MCNAPILFSPPMAKALRQGHKTQTRRLVVPQPTREDALWPTFFSHLTWEDILSDTDYYVGCGYCPYGKVGDRLWVRESWRTIEQYDSLSPTEIMEEVKNGPSFSGLMPHLPLWYSDDTTVEWRYNDMAGRWRASIHMPKALAQTSLLITQIRLQRVNEITRVDALAEGIDRDDLALYYQQARRAGVLPPPGAMERGMFSVLWDTIHREHFTWHDDPWVWSISFQVEPIMINDQDAELKFQEVLPRLTPLPT